MYVPLCYTDNYGGSKSHSPSIDVLLSFNEADLVNCHMNSYCLCAIIQVGIDPEDVNAEVLPSHKTSQIKHYQSDKKKVCTLY